jgi:V-type H+-transporting ATPase subunit d
MINNTLKMIQSVRSGKNALETYYKLHPLGYYSSIQSVSAVSSIDELYSIVLVDSPIGKFFTKTVKQDFEEFSMEFIKNLLYKNWIESFYDYVQTLDDITRINMSRILEFEADQTVITITKNSFNLKTELPPDEKLSLYPQIGQLLDFHVELSKVPDDDKLKELLIPYPEYYDLFTKSTQGESMTDLFAKRSVQLNKWSFDDQFHFGVFYSFLKLKEYEIKNLALVANCITLSAQEKINEKIIDLQ